MHPQLAAGGNHTEAHPVMAELPSFIVYLATLFCITSSREPSQAAVRPWAEYTGVKLHTRNDSLLCTIEA